MRVILTTLLVYTMCLATYGQSPYIPIQFKNANYRYNGSGANGPNTINAHTFHTYIKDTSINGSVYSKIYSSCYSFLASSLCDQTPYHFDGKYYVFLRNDSINRKVYFFDEQSAQDSLLYDFSLSIGDTLSGYNRMFNTLVLNSIDSILLGTKWHRKFNFHFPGGQTSIIEGVGGTNSFYDSWINSGGFASKALICYSVDNSIIYPASRNGQMSDCNYPLNQQPFQEKEIQYSFQNNQLFIQDFKGAISVYSVNGQKVLEKNVNANLSLSLDNLNPSIYILKFQSEHQHKVDKVIVR